MSNSGMSQEEMDFWNNKENQERVFRELQPGYWRGLYETAHKSLAAKDTEIAELREVDKIIREALKSAEEQVNWQYEENKRLRQKVEGLRRWKEAALGVCDSDLVVCPGNTHEDGCPDEGCQSCWDAFITAKADLPPSGGK